MSLYETIVQAVPTGKAVAWIGTAVVTSFLAGVGWVTSASHITEAVQTVPRLDSIVALSQRDITTLQREVREAEGDRKRMLCLIRLSVQGEVLTAVEVDFVLRNPDTCRT